jgi:nickel-dependent lactate racemase
MVRLRLPNLLWYGNEPREIWFPDRWEIEVLEPPGFSKPPLDEEKITAALQAPIGAPRLEELAAGSSEAVIVFDDMTRPTPVKVILPAVLRALGEGGIGRENIRLIPALGMHGAMNNIDFRKKLGEEVVESYPVYNHNPYENCDFLGESPGGIPVFLNREFLSCDLRIGIGCITPHVHVGFGGGGKIVLPGISGAETIKYFHKEVIMRDPSTTGLGKTEGNVMYQAVREVTAMSGLRFKIDALVNARGEITDLYAGDPLQAFEVGVEEARIHYGVQPCSGRDVVVANAYAKYNEMAICMLLALAGVNMERGIVVLLVDAPEGQVCHYLMRSFGKDYGGECYVKRGAPPGGVKVIVCSRYPDPTMCDLFAAPGSVIVVKEWEQVLEILEKEYPGEAAVAVIPDGTMQYFREG